MIMSPQEEFASAELGDKRRTKRCQKILDKFVRHPESSFPEMMGNQAELEALYRVLRNPDIDPNELFRAHAKSTRERIDASGQSSPLIAHDTTTFHLPDDDRRESFGQPHGVQDGFVGHQSLVIDNKNRKHPLGLANLSPIFRSTSKQSESGPWDKKSSLWTKWYENGQPNESWKWPYGINKALKNLGNNIDPIHLMDRGAMSYRFVGWLKSNDHRFVMRLCQPHRRVAPYQNQTKLKDALKQAPSRFNRCVHIEDTSVELSVRAVPITLQKPAQLTDKQLPEGLTINVVYLKESEPSDDQSAIEWMLATSEPIETQEDIQQIIDMYRARWLIEEFHRALKAGCRLEDRQLRRKQTILTALALAVPVAWHLLALRTIRQTHPDKLASKVIDELHLTILEAQDLTQWPEQCCPTTSDVVRSIAELGGHLPQNGPPGWITLTRGYRKLIRKAETWLNAQQFWENKLSGSSQGRDPTVNDSPDL